MPWKGIKNPYHIWLSEIILQQTRVEQGWKYYENFVKHFPQIEDLAQAPEDQVMKLWEGLGYYSRARNMHFTAKHIVENLSGIFPTSYEDIIKLKGIGPYTAAAISSFAYNLPHAVVDGNVYRVLARFFAIQTASDSTEGKKQFNELANRLIHPKKAALYNQAIMDFGAQICTPKNPSCSTCDFKRKCAAYEKGLVFELPKKEKRLKKRLRYLLYFLPKGKSKLYIQKREQKDIWKHLYELPRIELEQKKSIDEIQSHLELNHGKKASRDLRFSAWQKHILTHQTIHCLFIHASAQLCKSLAEKNALHVERKAIHHYAFPRLIDCYFKENHILLAEGRLKKDEDAQ